MPSSTRNKARFALGLGAVVLTLSGCGSADYLNHWDTVSFRGGNAHMANTGIQTIEAFPRATYNTPIDADG